MSLISSATVTLLCLQNLGETGLPYLITLNPPHTPDHTLLKWSTGHPVPSVAASKASIQLNQIQGKRGIWFCGAYQGKLLPFSKIVRHFFWVMLHIYKHTWSLLSVLDWMRKLIYRLSLSFFSGYGFHEDGLKVDFNQNRICISNLFHDIIIGNVWGQKI